MAASAPVAAPRQAFSGTVVLPSRSIRAAPRPARHSVVTRADQNLALSVVSSVAAAGVVAGVTLATAPNRDAEIERIQTVDGAVPLAAAVVADAAVHSVPGVDILLGLLTEPVGAACGVAYMMSMLLSASAIDPETLAPKGTVLSVETAKDNSSGVRKPFTRIIPTTLAVIDYENEGSSGKGWNPKEGLPKLPINSVLIVLGVGCLILEAASHAPVLSFFMPRVLCLAAWYAAAGYFLDKRA